MLHFFSQGQDLRINFAVVPIAQDANGLKSPCRPCLCSLCVGVVVVKEFVNDDRTLLNQSFCLGRGCLLGNSSTGKSSNPAHTWN